MAWWDSKHQSLDASPRPKKHVALGDAFPKLDLSQPATNHPPTIVHRTSSLLLPISEEQYGSRIIQNTPPLVIHVNIQFTDPVIRSSYSQSYVSSHTFKPSNRNCNGLLRRIEHCSHELLTRKDSGALEIFKDETYERKTQRFEMTFRIVRRGLGEWAERTFRSFQQQPLTVAQTKEIILASQRMVALFLRRHDKNFQWLDTSDYDPNLDDSEFASPPNDSRLSFLCIPSSRFIKSSQSFEFVPGYSIELSFRSHSHRRKVATYARVLKVNSNQTAPLILLMGENIQWRAVRAINQALEFKKQEFDGHLLNCPMSDCQHSDNNALDIELRISNNLGPGHSLIRRNITSRLALFRDPEARDCDDFLQSLEACFHNARDDADAKINDTNDFEFRLVHLKGAGWSIRQPEKFTLDQSTSYGRRTIQAACDRIQTGISDVLRGHDVAVHITAHKRGHLILDKAIVAHAKHGRPRETFHSPEEEEATFVHRLRKRIQQDIDMVFRDTCSIDDIAQDDDEEDQESLNPVIGIEADYAEQIDAVLREPSLPTPVETPTEQLQHFSISPARRAFSLTRRSASANLRRAASMEGLWDSRPAKHASVDEKNWSSSDLVNDGPEKLVGEPSLLAAASVTAAPTKPMQRRFPLMPKRLSSTNNPLHESALARDSFHAGAVPANTNCNDEVKKSSRADISLRCAETFKAPERQEATENQDSSSIESSGTYEDEEEFLPGLASKDIAKCETPSRFRRVMRLGADEESLAPSTPALSSGGDSSPRNSILITPTYLRTLSGTKYSAIVDFEPEYHEPTMGVEPEMDMVSARKGQDHREHAFVGSYPIGSASSVTSPETVAASGLAVDGTDSGSKEENERDVADSEHAATDDALAAETLDTTPHSGLEDDQSTLTSFNDPGFGSECDAKTDKCCLQEPDIPTVLRWTCPNEGPVPELHPSSAPGEGTEKSSSALDVNELGSEDANFLSGAQTGSLLEFEHISIPSQHAAELVEVSAEDDGVGPGRDISGSLSTPAGPETRELPTPDANNNTPVSVSQTDVNLTDAHVGSATGPQDLIVGNGIGALVDNQAEDGHGSGPEADVTDTEIKRRSLPVELFDNEQSTRDRLAGNSADTADDEDNEDDSRPEVDQDLDLLEREFKESSPVTTLELPAADQSIIHASVLDSRYIGDERDSQLDVILGNQISDCEVRQPQTNELEIYEPDSCNETGNNDTTINLTGRGTDSEAELQAVANTVNNETIIDTSGLLGDDLASQSDPAEILTSVNIEPELATVCSEAIAGQDIADVQPLINVKGNTCSETVTSKLEADDEAIDVGLESAAECPVASPCNSLPQDDQAAGPESEPHSPLEILAFETPRSLGVAEESPLLNSTTSLGQSGPLLSSPPTALSIRSCDSLISELSDPRPLFSERGSVEDIRPFGDEWPNSSFAPEDFESRPQTAGYLGLGDTGRLHFGIRGSKARLRRFSTPLQYMLDPQGKETGRPSTSGAPVGGSKARKGKNRLDVVEPAAPRQDAVVEDSDDGQQVLPRMMMLLAGAVVISKILKGSSH
ncbi:hypothetical protein B0T22DRAFT_454389 [Podospora appendiculata]|uniref:Pt repeat family protein n=1 Tax=Podospora appendiculata TaxID=314037 RepID=A0AAE1CI14_9PEZI|nr:hypothetical protein B0T22DRAFT_454389 [Podospora appendiculata]